MEHLHNIILDISDMVVSSVYVLISFVMCADYMKTYTVTQSLSYFEKVQVGNDQEMAQSERSLTPKTEGWEKTQLTLRYLY